MADFRVTVNDAVLKKLMSTAPKKADQLIRALAFEGQSDVQRSFTTSPSSPGETPGVDTGTLKNSIRVMPVAPFAQSIMTDVEYAPFLEYGTSRMAARPFFQPMARRLEKKIPEYFKNWID